MDLIVAIGGLCILAWWTRLFLNNMKYTQVTSRCRIQSVFNQRLSASNAVYSPKIKIKDKKIENQ